MYLRYSMSHMIQCNKLIFCDGSLSGSYSVSTARTGFSIPSEGMRHTPTIMPVGQPRREYVPPGYANPAGASYSTVLVKFRSYLAGISSVYGFTSPDFDDGYLPPPPPLRTAENYQVYLIFQSPHHPPQHTGFDKPISARSVFARLNHWDRVELISTRCNLERFLRLRFFVYRYMQTAAVQRISGSYNTGYRSRQQPIFYVFRTAFILRGL